MMIIEARQAAKDKAFDLIDEIKDLDRKKKIVFCELEETLYDCFESSEDEDDEEVESEYESGEGEDQNVDFRKYTAYKHDRKFLHGMRHDDDDSHQYRRRAMRMRRRNRMGRFV